MQSKYAIWAGTAVRVFPELEPVVCVGQKKSKAEADETVSENTSANNSSSLFNIYLSMLKKWWNNSLHYEEKEVSDRMSQDLSYLVDFFRITAGKVNVLSKDCPYYDKVFWRRFWPRKERDKIEGDKGAIEATIDDKFKAQLEESNEPNKTSFKTNIATMFDYFNEDSTKIHRVINGDTINTAILNKNGTYYFQ